MRVAIVQEHADAARGGAETSTLEMARHLAALDLDLTLVCTGDGGDHGPDEHGVRRRTVAVGAGSRLSRTVRFIGEADRYCRMRGFDIVHAVTPCFAANVYQPRGGTYVETVARSVALAKGPIGRLAKRLGRRFNRRQRFLLLLERQMLSGRTPPLVAAVSEYVRHQVQTAFSLPEDRVRVVFNGVDVANIPDERTAAEHRQRFRSQMGASADAALVLFVAHNFKLKGLAELLGALAGWTTADGPAWRLAVAGRDDPARYARLARRWKIDDRVHFMGPDVPMHVLYSAADVLAHPTWYDPCSRVVLEALCHGLPVVTTRFNGAAEVIREGANGAIVDAPDDAAALRAALDRCLAPALRRRCAEQAAEARQRLSMARHARELRSLYAEVAGAAAGMPA